MKLAPGIIITIVVVLLFYMRLIALQWGKAKRAKEYDEAFKQSKGKKGKKKIQEKSPMEKYGFQVKSMPWVVVSIICIIIGVVMNAYPALLPAAKDYWWVGIFLGVVIMGINLK
jgi:H+/gluconate symporter-like permease